jgi:transketolase
MGSSESLKQRFEAFGWSTRIVDGHNIPAMIETLSELPFSSDKPSAIVAQTRAGSGISFMEDQVLWHYRVPSDEDLARAMKELGQTDGGAQ